MKTKIVTDTQFNAEKERHLANLEAIRAFILGDEYNQPQVTNHRFIADFFGLYSELEGWLEDSYNDGSED